MSGTKSASKTLLVVIFLAIPCCRDLGTDPSLAFWEDSIMEAVFRHVFVSNYSCQQQGAHVYFVGRYIPRDSTHPGYYADLSEEFMARFRENPTPVKKTSECNWSGYGVFDKRTGESGLLFWIESIRELGSDQVEVSGGYFESGISASTDRYIVKRVDGIWIVIRDYLTGIA